MAAEPGTPPTKAEVTALLVGWRALERARARARLATEKRALRLLSDALQLQVSRLADRLEVSRSLSGPAALKSTAIAGISQAVPHVQAAMAGAVLAARSDARETSRQRTEAELAHLRTLLRRDGYDGADLPSDPEPGDSEHDSIAAGSAASSVSSRWATAALAATLAWEADPSGSLAYAIRRTAAGAAPQLETVAATEVSTAFNEEHDDGLEQLSEYPWSAGVFKVWSAILDGRVCNRCYEQDGQTVPVDKPWKDGASQPMHPRCRCMEVPLYIPKPKALQDVASDYSAYKAEIRDQIRESRRKPGPSVATPGPARNAPQFIERSKPGRSPQVISKDFAVGRLSSGRTAVGRLARRTGT